MAEAQNGIGGAADGSPGADRVEPARERSPQANEAQLNMRIGYQVAANLYMQENQVTWARFNVMLAANSIILAATGVAAGGANRLLALALILPIVGLSLCGIWRRMMKRGFDYHDVWRDAALRLERRYLSQHVITLEAGERLRSRAVPAGERASVFSLQVINLFQLLYCVAIVQIVVTLGIAACQVHEGGGLCGRAASLLERVLSAVLGT